MSTLEWILANIYVASGRDHKQLRRAVSEICYAERVLEFYELDQAGVDRE